MFIESGDLNLTLVGLFCLGAKHIGGGLSHQCFVPESECIHIDSRLSQKDAATITQGYSNALLAFTKYAPIKERDDIVIIVGPGGEKVF